MSLLRRRNRVPALDPTLLEKLVAGETVHVPSDRRRAYAPHCDSSILHAPGECEFCDAYPDWQDARKKQRVAFTGQQPDEHRAPCPSEWFRSPEIRDRWPGNRASWPAAT